VDGKNFSAYRGSTELLDAWLLKMDRDGWREFVIDLNLTTYAFQKKKMGKDLMLGRMDYLE